ncbi:class A beta-lactamase [Mucilaginibacter auburnensis]|uniref:beta-lactamase n=1 Tax=Mucilaginibacter auburnensis TaxID=1457233 RepID=A0A2H9VNJ6_9SPHI|nr:class A beta-lactamase [Mucilaginibacter auburnensis]PJJ79894.1 beta-lactamase class A [Mucilaginibacter auburnensis]
MLNKYITAVLLGFLAFSAKAQSNIQQQITDIARDAKGIVSFTALNLETRDSVSYHGEGQMVMQSVMKFPIALAVLHEVERGKFSLDQTFKISDRDMHHKNGPLFEKYPKGVNIPLSELLTYMVSYSDNNACDILLDKIGGVKPVMDNLRRLRVKGIVVDASELDMSAAWEVQYTNWCKPAAMVQLLDVFYQGKALDKANTDTLIKKMLQTTTGPKQIKGLLPQGTVVAHKTGRSNTNAEGVTAATNDVGIITLPNGQHLAIAIFIGNSTADLDTRESVIARITKALWDANFTKPQKAK